MESIAEETEDQVTHTARRISGMLQVMFDGHDSMARDPKSRVRKTDGMPYGVHPGFAAFLMLHEMHFPMEERLVYAESLNFHDWDEDTLTGAVPTRSSRVKHFVTQLTFPKGGDNSALAIERGPQIAMLKSYDSTTNLFGLDRIQWTMKKKIYRIESAIKLFTFARPHYPNLYLWPIADAVVADMSARIGYKRIQ